jgi:hypothetical protein
MTIHNQTMPIFDLGRFKETIICCDCNSADASAGRKIGFTKELFLCLQKKLNSLSMQHPMENTRFYTMAKSKANRMLAETMARQLYESLKFHPTIRMEVAEPVHVAGHDLLSFRQATIDVDNISSSTLHRWGTYTIGSTTAVIRIGEGGLRRKIPNREQWLREFTHTADLFSPPSRQIKPCYRTPETPRD